MKLTKTVIVMLCIIGSLASVALSYQFNFFYYGQLNILAYRYFPTLYNTPDDFHHSPLLGCSPIEGEDIHTHFFHIAVTTQLLDSKHKNDRGGGLTSRKNDLLVLTSSGDLYLATDKDITRTGIELPDNGNAAFEVARVANNYKAPDTPFRFDHILALDAGLLVSYSEWHDTMACYTRTVAFLPLDSGLPSIASVKADAADWQILFRSNPCLPARNQGQPIRPPMGGGRMAAYSANAFLLTVGDFTADNIFPTGSNPQALDNDYGKILLIHVDTGAVEVFSMGHRNPQGIVVANNGEVWSVEHGPRGGDELNRIERGNNYGWPRATLGTTYTAMPVRLAAQFGRHDNYTPPTYAWIPSRAVSNIIQIDGFDPTWDGDFLVSTLSMQRLYRLRIKNQRVIFSEPLCIGQPARYVHQHTNGQLFVLADQGTLYALTRPIKPEANQYAEAFKTLNQCIECHSPEGGNGTAPSIFSLANHLSEQHIRSYISNPKAMNPQSQMPGIALSENQMNDVVDALAMLTK
ncbi:MAG: PQQ-dependent sugar dehydrogenase [Bacteroidota bacterium]